MEWIRSMLSGTIAGANIANNNAFSSITTVNVILLLGVILYTCFLSRKSRSLKLPPGPFPWPIVGNLFTVKSPLQRHFAELSVSYGPLIYLKFGQSSIVVANTSEMARLFLKVHDLEFAYRPSTTFYKELSNGYKDLIFASYGDSWRKMKKISVVHLFSPSGLNATAPSRKEEIKRTLTFVLQQSKSGVLVNMREVLGRYTSNLMCLMLFGHQEPATVESLLQLVDKMINQALNINIGELFPALDFLDLHGVNRKMKDDLMPRMRSELGRIIEQHKQKKAKNPDFQFKDFTDVLLSLEGDEALPDISIMSLLLDMAVAALETSQTAVEWIMAELISHPEMLLKAQKEVDSIAGKDRLVEECELPQLPYIQAVVKEALRLHPPAPLGVPHLNEKEMIVAGYRIPAKSKVFVNVWAIGRDPNSWNEAEVFKPERFMDSDVNLIGQHFELLPFSAGRRMCTGFALALRTVPLAVASLVQAFDWKAAPGQAIDLAELKNLSVCRMANALHVSATPRLEEALYL